MSDSLQFLKSKLLIFLPTPNEVQRFILSHAFDDLHAHYNLIFVLPTELLAEMAPLVRSVFPHATIREIADRPDRFKEWQQLFKSACKRFAHKSDSFALRHRADIKAPAQQSR